MKYTYGFARVGAASPQTRVADPIYNALSHVRKMREAEARGVRVLGFPELGITDYFCRDLFLDDTLQRGAVEGLRIILEASKTQFSGLFSVGMPLIVQGMRLNASIFINRGKILGAQPKLHIPNNGEFEEWRWFTSGAGIDPCYIELLRQEVPFGPMLYEEENEEEDVNGADQKGKLIVAGDQCQDIWTAIPPSIYGAQAGATVLLNGSASSATAGKSSRRRRLITAHSARTYAAVVYAALGPSSSTASVVFDGQSMIAEDDALLVEANTGRHGSLIAADVDLDWITTERTTDTSWAENRKYNPPPHPYRTVKFKSGPRRTPTKLLRHIDARPAVPK
jgi:NAD+ synthase (glutamine-hydrolysing)